jgi:hypothetical protein
MRLTVLRMFVTMIVLAGVVALSATPERAAALELCATAEKECAEENVYEEGTLLVAKTSDALIESSIGAIACSSTGEFETAAEAGQPLPGYITKLSFSGCMLGKTECTVSEVDHVYYGLLTETKENGGSLTISDGGAGAPGGLVECGALSCKLSAKELVLTATGGKPASLEVSKAGFGVEGGFLCPESASLTAAYEVTAPAAVQIARRTTMLCKAAPNAQGACPIEQRFKGKVEAELITNVEAKFTTGSETPKTVSCDEAPVLSDEFENNGEGILKEIKFKTAAGPCSSDFAGEPVVKFLMDVNRFDDSSFSYRTNTKAILVAASTENPLFRMTIEYGTPVFCGYRLTRSSWKIFAYNPLKMESRWNFAYLGSNMACPGLLALTGEWILTQSGGGALWVAKT